MAENKMAEVAQLFGKKLGEEFVAEYIGRKDIIDTARFTVDGFETKNAFGNWVEDLGMLMWLLKGEAVIVNAETFKLAYTAGRTNPQAQTAQA